MTELTELAEQINAEYNLAEDAFATHEQHRRRCGEALRKARDLLPPRKFAPWLEKHTKIPISTAYRYMGEKPPSEEEIKNPSQNGKDKWKDVPEHLLAELPAAAYCQGIIKHGDRLLAVLGECPQEVTPEVVELVHKLGMRVRELLKQIECNWPPWDPSLDPDQSQGWFSPDDRRWDEPESEVEPVEGYRAWPRAERADEIVPL